MRLMIQDMKDHVGEINVLEFRTISEIYYEC